VVILITAGLTYYIAKSGPGAAGTNQTKPTITVQGQSTRAVMPDQLSLGLSVVGNGTTVAQSQADAAAKVAALKAALIAQGVKEGDIQSSSYYTSPVYNNSCYYCSPKPIPYDYGQGASGAPAPAPSGSDVGVSTPGAMPSQPDIAPIPPRPYCDYNQC